MKLYFSKSRGDDMFRDNGYAMATHQSGTDDMFIEPGIQSIINKSRRDGMFIAQGNTTTHHQSRRDDMFIDNGYNKETHQSRRDDMFNNTINQPTQEKLNYGTQKNDIAPIWVPSFTINMPSLRDLRWVSESFFSINISSLREYIISITKKCNPFIHFQSGTDDMFIEPGIQSIINKSRRDDMFITSEYHIAFPKSGTDDMFIDNGYAIATQQPRRDDMFITSEYHIASPKSGTDDMFIDNGYAMATHQSRRDDMFNNTINQPTQKKLYYNTQKNNIAPIWVPSFTINMPSLRDLRWVSVSFFSINISSLREYIKKSRRDGMFITNRVTHLTHKSRRDDMFIENGYDNATQQSRRDDMFITLRNATLTKSINNQTFIKYGQYIYTNLHPFGFHR
jgi:hypothetical protein